MCSACLFFKRLFVFINSFERRFITKLYFEIGKYFFRLFMKPDLILIDLSPLNSNKLYLVKTFIKMNVCILQYRIQQREPRAYWKCSSHFSAVYLQSKAFPLTTQSSRCEEIDQFKWNSTAQQIVTEICRGVFHIVTEICSGTRFQPRLKNLTVFSPKELDFESGSNKFIPTGYFLYLSEIYCKGHRVIMIAEKFHVTTKMWW